MINTCPYSWCTCNKKSTTSKITKVVVNKDVLFEFAFAHDIIEIIGEVTYPGIKTKYVSLLTDWPVDEEPIRSTFKLYGTQVNPRYIQPIEEKL